MKKQFLHTALYEENIARLKAGTWLSFCIMLFSVFLILIKHNPSAGVTSNVGGCELWGQSRLRYSLRNKRSGYYSDCTSSSLDCVPPNLPHVISRFPQSLLEISYGRLSVSHFHVTVRGYDHNLIWFGAKCLELILLN